MDVASGDEGRSSEQSSDPEASAKLSRTEHFRLTRAFYYLELFGQLFCTAIERSAIDASMRQQWTQFLEKLRDFELEELLCIRRYLIDNLVIYLSQIEDDFVNEYTHEQLYMIEPQKPKSRWENDDWFFSISGHHGIPDWLEDCLTVGLEELKTMLTADTMDDRFYSLRFTFVTQGIWRRALNAMPRYRERIKSRKDVEPHIHAGFRDDVDKASFGWLWDLNLGGHPRKCHNYAHNDFVENSRRWGYVIWDYNRLSSFGIFTERGYEITEAFSEGMTPGTWTRSSVEERIEKQVEQLKREGRLLSNPPPEPPSRG